VYCQLGPTQATAVGRRPYQDHEQLVAEIGRRLDELSTQSHRVDFVTFVPDGEPTLDEGLGPTLEALGGLGVPTAVITNGSLLHDPDVRRALAHARWVSVKVDAGDDETWRAINRPDPELRFADVVEGARQFAAAFEGTLVTETMLVEGVNDTEAAVRKTAERIAELSPATAYIGIPTRPPGESWVRPPSEEAIARAFAVFAHHGVEAEILSGYPTPDFAPTADVESELLRITAVHPMRDVEVQHLLDLSGASWARIEPLLAQGQLRRVEYRGQAFFVRATPSFRKPTQGAQDD
jgi:wyosine [tRNA(Phe)-imidazoG37] synthetase (radical SAM superfamily)